MREMFGGRGMSVLTASVLLGLMILPTIISISEASIRAVPKSYYEGGIALGASHEKKCIFDHSSCCQKWYFSSVVLGIGRAIG